MKQYKDFEAVIGLEIHVELKTRTKIFCSCETSFGAEPNTKVCPVCMGHPGTLPTLNRGAVRLAVRAGLALGCEIAENSRMDRKNYFYPDLPKAYQISQYDMPLCREGHLDIEAAEQTKRVRIERIHIEEDAGKLIHSAGETLIDHNRCGVPLIEIVTYPDISSAEEAKVFMQKLRSIMLYADISDCRMNEGSLRCDVNISVRRRGDTKLGTRAEVKNINSFAFVAKAIEYEYRRQAEAIERGERIVRETRRFDESTGKTFSMRSKEGADDYRFFPEPDLPAFSVSRELVSEIEAEIPMLPDARRDMYIERLSLPRYDAELISSQKTLALLFEAAAEKTEYPKLLANLLLGEGLRLSEGDEFALNLSSADLAALVELWGRGEINSSTAKKLFLRLAEGESDPRAIAERENLWQIKDREALRRLVCQVLDENPSICADYRAGKRFAAKSALGKVMGKCGGLAEPVVLAEVLEEELDRERA